MQPSPHVTSLGCIVLIILEMGFLVSVNSYYKLEFPQGQSFGLLSVKLSLQQGEEENEATRQRIGFSFIYFFFFFFKKRNGQVHTYRATKAVRGSNMPSGNAVSSFWFSCLSMRSDPQVTSLGCIYHVIHEFLAFQSIKNTHCHAPRA